MDSISIPHEFSIIHFLYLIKYFYLSVPLYCFHLDSKFDRPNGAVNMSQLKNISLNIETLPVASSDCYFILDLYAVQYNQLHIVNGIGGLKWSH